jgi:Skp family chaperone for outer membrane proteins
MNLSQTTPLALLATLLAATASPKFALVRVTDIYSSLPSTATMEAELKKERDEIMRDERADQLRKIIGELQTLQAQLSDKTNPPDEPSSRSMMRAYELKRQEAQTLQQEFESFKSERELEINRRMVTEMRASLNRIVQVSDKLAAEKGFDAVFDRSGNTNTGVPFVLYSKDAPDLTAAVQAALKETTEARTAATPD